MMMLRHFSGLLDRVSEFIAARKGLLPIIGILLIAINFALTFFPGAGWVVTSNLFLHLGVVISILGILLAWAL
jgi:hypothetical protein